MKTKLFLLMLTLMVGIGKAPAESGTCGANLTWDLTDGILTISGTGDMKNFGYGGAPWYSTRSTITTVNIGNGVTIIGNCAFYGCSSLTSVIIPNSVTSIGSGAFDGCSSLTSIIIPNSVTSIGDYAFYECRSLTSVTIPNGVKSIGSAAFRDCSSLTSIIIPNSVTSIGGRAFYNCSSLTSVTIPNSVTSIGSEAFSDCNNLASVSIPNSVTSIGSYAFNRVPNIIYTGDATGSPWGARSVNGFVDGYLVYSDETKTNLLACSPAFAGELTIPNSVTSIGSSAFYYCTSLTSITIPNSVTSIGEYAFSYCSGLKEVHITDLVAWCKIIFGDVNNEGANPLGHAHNLYLNGELITDLTIPDGVTSIGECAFEGCSSLTSVTIPNSVTNIGRDAFKKCSGLTGVYIKDLVAWCKINFNVVFGTSSDNPLAYAHNLYLNGNLVTDLTIPDGVTSIGSGAFYGCSSLTSVRIPNGVTSIGNGAFSECTSLNSVTIPNSVTSIEYAAFYECTSLTSVTIPNSVTNIGDYAFYNVANIVYHGSATGSPWGARSVNGFVDGYLVYSDETKTNLLACCPAFVGNLTIPNSVTSIGGRAFYNCNSLTSVTIPNSVTNIGDYAFYNVANIVYHGSATGSPWGARNVNGFVDGYLVYSDETKTNLLACSSAFVGNLTIPNCVTSIGDYAFYSCNSLTSVVIPNSVTSIGNYAFYKCSGLTSVTIPNSVTSIGRSAFNGCTGLTSVTIGNSVTRISDYAFYNCSSLTSVTIGNSVRSIGSSVFDGCSSLTSVTIPNSVTSIGDRVFYDCKSLKYIICNAINPPYLGAEHEMPTTIPIFIPTGSFASYSLDYKWKSLNIIYLSSIEYVEQKPTSVNMSIHSNLWEIVSKSTIVSCGIEGGEMFEGNTLEFIGLEPNSEYTDVPIVVTSNIGETATIPIYFTTSALELTTQPAKPVSESTAILLAETNMADIETSCGFEWRRYDAPEEMPSNTVWCPVASRQMAGRLKNLKDDVYYKYRAFYQSAAGNMYYGDWQYIFTGDVAVEFDPILYTYEATDVKRTQARLRGYALAGSEDFTEQGFEYWMTGRNTESSSANAPQAGHLRINSTTDETVHHTVTASGISMSVSLTNLDEGTVYHYRSYAKIGDKVLYGSEMSFTTQGEYHYTVTFLDYDNSVIDTRQTTYGNSVEAPEAPLHEGLEFVGWDTDFSSVTDDITVKAVYADVVTGFAEKTNREQTVDSQLVRKVFDPQSHTIFILMPDGRIYNLLGRKIR